MVTAVNDASSSEFVLQYHPKVKPMGRAMVLDLSEAFGSVKLNAHMTLLSFHRHECTESEKEEMRASAQHLINQLAVPIVGVHRVMGRRSDEIFGDLVEVFKKTLQRYPQHAPRPTAWNAVKVAEGIWAVPPHVELR